MRRKPAAGKARKRRCQHCQQLFVPAHRGRFKQTCPFCGELNYKRVSIGQLEKRADALFSRLARYKRADSTGHVRCCTCGVRKPWTEVDNGHYMSRSFRAVRWSWDNCWPQCKPCNSGYGANHWAPNESVKQAYTAFLEVTLGEGAAEEIWQRAVHGGNRPNREQLEELIWQLERQCKAAGLDTT